MWVRCPLGCIPHTPCRSQGQERTVPSSRTLQSRCYTLQVFPEQRLTPSNVSNDKGRTDYEAPRGSGAAMERPLLHDEAHSRGLRTCVPDQPWNTSFSAGPCSWHGEQPSNYIRAHASRSGKYNQRDGSDPRYLDKYRTCLESVRSQNRRPMRLQRPTAPERWYDCIRSGASI